MSHIAIYGNVKILRGICRSCGTTAFIEDGRLACCGARANVEPSRYVRVSEPDFERKRPSVLVQKQILNEQGNLCYYCLRRFGQEVYYRGRRRATTLRIHWDHKVPWIFSQNNNPENFVAACHICNGIKSDKCFTDVDTARVYIAGRWQEKNYLDEMTVEAEA